jgi:hypothetical protein
MAGTSLVFNPHLSLLELDNFLLITPSPLSLLHFHCSDPCFSAGLTSPSEDTGDEVRASQTNARSAIVHTGGSEEQVIVGGRNRKHDVFGITTL